MQDAKSNITIGVLIFSLFCCIIGAIPILHPLFQFAIRDRKILLHIKCMALLTMFLLYANCGTHTVFALLEHSKYDLTTYQ